MVSSPRVGGFLRFLCVIDGRSRDQILSILGCSRATVTRYLADARAFGCVIEFDRSFKCYSLRDPGPFDVRRLRMADYPPAKKQCRSRRSASTFPAQGTIGWLS